jgi:hypothetical protein
MRVQSVDFQKRRVSKIGKETTAMKRLFSMVLVVSVCMGGVIAMGDVATTDAQGVPQQLQILNGKVDEIQQTLNAIQNSLISGPAWFQILPSAQRFHPVMGGQAVLDMETGLVWEKSPSPISLELNMAIRYCADLNVGGRKGWHLPTIEQLASLVDTSVAGSPKLPSGHPFLNVQTAGFLPNSFAFYFAVGGGVRFDTGDVIVTTNPGCTDGSCGNTFQWCARSGYGYATWPLP